MTSSSAQKWKAILANLSEADGVSADVDVGVQLFLDNQSGPEPGVSRTHFTTNSEDLDCLAAHLTTHAREKVGCCVS